MNYFVPRGGLPPQTDLTTDRAVFTESYAVLPRRTMSDITASLLPHWNGTRRGCWRGRCPDSRRRSRSTSSRCRLVAAVTVPMPIRAPRPSCSLSTVR